MCFAAQHFAGSVPCDRVIYDLCYTLRSCDMTSHDVIASNQTIGSTHRSSSYSVCEWVKIY